MNPFPVIGKTLAEERGRWFLWAPASIGFGIAVYFALPFEPSLWALIATPVMIAALILARHRLGFLIAAIFFLTFALGFNAGQIDTRLSYTPMLDHQMGPVPVEGRLMYTEVMPDGVRLTLKDLHIGHLSPPREPVKLRVKFDNKVLADIQPPGARIKLWAEVGPFSDPVMPHATDFRWQSYFRQLGGLGWSYSHIEVIDPDPPAPLRDHVNLVFERARMALAQHVYARLTGDIAAMTAARLNGEQTGISQPVIEAMRIAGLAHLLSTSGFHVTIMGLLVYFPIRALLALIPWIALRYPIKKWAAAGAILSTLAYTLLVGSQAATLRSMMMTGIAMLAILLDRRAAPLRLVMLSAAIVMLIAPDAMLGPSFQMSFAAVFCLIAAHERRFEFLFAPDAAIVHAGPVRWIIGHFGLIMMTSLIATAATTPFAIYHFQTFSFYGFIANMLAIPLTSFWVMPCILMAYLTAPFGLDGWFIDGAGAGIALTIKIALTVASWPFSIFYLPAMPAFVLVMIVLGGLWLCLWQKRWRYLGLIPILIGAFYPFYTPKPDIMIAPDASEWAARLDDGTLAVSNLDRATFITSQWQQRLGNVPVVDVTALPPSETQLRCDEAGCVYRHGTYSVALPELPAAVREDCAHAAVVIAPVVIHDCAAPVVIDEPLFWRHGAMTLIFAGDTVHIAHARARRGERPWSPGWKNHADED